MAQALIPFRTVVIFSVLVSSTFAIKCFVCNSATQPNCANSPPPQEYLLECSQDTLEALNDYHRQLKLDDAATAAKQKNSSEPVKVLEDHKGHDHDDHVDGDSHEGHKHEKPHSPVTFDSDAKDMTLNRSTRAAPEIANNDTEEGPPLLHVIPVKIPKEATFCRKTSFHIPQQENGPNWVMPKSVRIIRSCGWIPEERSDNETNKCKWIGTEGVQMDQCVCSGDACNSANFINSLKAQTLLLMGLVAVGYYYIL